MTHVDADEMDGQQEQGELLRVVEDRLTTRGLQVSRMPDPCSGLVRVVPGSEASPEDYPVNEVVFEDDGYVELRYWPPAEQLGDPLKIADLIADFLFRDLVSPAEA
jgi:hypothetical protein